MGNAEESVERVNALISMFSNYKEDDIDKIVFDLVYELKKIREIKGMSQKQLAEKADLSQTAISRFETMAYKPSLHMLLKIVMALDCKLILDAR